ncbi:PAS domain-containing sensor histidine kinase [Geomonas azotofigens]|uniref:PAS domain-containing sensor histidine kinase n=1 Tax=Geomonas azotofigens TaxID=2843196 RepID=UPI001C122705|nr:PAS domain-containing sensor histidine kinase [Geomonas azotofigens]MBU5615045.1 PAS domain S-box protein [Geomonas azotofigens]
MFDSLEQCRALFDELPLGMFIQGPDGTPLEVNAAALEMFGMERELFLRHNPEHPQWQLCTPQGIPLPPDQHPAISAFLGTPVREINLAINNRRKGRLVPVCMDAMALKGKDGAPPSHVCVVFREAQETERALQESESRYHAMVQTQAEFVVRYRRGGMLTFVNDTYCRYLQKEREALLGQNFYPFFFLQDREALMRCVESMDGEQQGQTLEVRAWLPDGRLVWQKWSNSAIVDETGHVVEFQATGMDITRSKQTEESLKKSEERYRSLFDNMLNGFAYCRMILDSSRPQDFVFLEVNQSFERLTGLRGASGRRMSEVLPGVWESDPELLASFRRVALSGKAEQMECYVKAISEWLAVSVYSPEPGCFVIVFDVITKRKRTEECLAFLAQSTAHPGPDQQFFQSLARYLAATLEMDYICIDQLEECNLWARTVAVYFNGSFEENVRYALRDTPCGEVVGRNICCYREGVRHLFPNDQVLQDLGAESYLGVVLWSSTGVPIGLIAIIGRKPLSNRELAEEILQMVSGRAAAELERRLHEEERLRLEQQLLHAQKLESLGILAGGIAHDFNNILTGILGNSSLGLMRIAPDSPAVENLQNIEKGAIRAADLARQMLAYSGKGMFVVEPVSLNSLLTEMIHLLEVSISKRCHLALELAQALPPVQADSTQLRQIVMNLVINASEAIGERGGTITIRSGCRHFDEQYLKGAWAEKEITEGEFLFLQVEDDGCGMDDATLSRIFDPFFTTKFTGRGLGMSAVLGIIRGHRGAIKVESKPGRGTTFTVLLPVSELPVQDQPERQPPEEPWQGSGTVLLVDDEEIICDVGASMLEQLGYQVVTALSGGRAVELYRERGDVRFVILDLTMPQMDGEQTFQELRNLDPEVKVIISSGYSEQEVTRKLSGTGYLAFIQKPYSMQALSEVMRRCDTRRRAARR